MQRDSTAGSDEAPPPDPDVTVVDEIDLSKEIPSKAANVRRYPEGESSTLALIARIWKAAHVDIRYDVRGPASWAAPLCTVLIAEAIAAALLVPHVVLTADAPDNLRVAVGAAAGGVVLATGVGVLLYLVRGRS